MDQMETIRLLYESEGKSLREICRVTGRDFRTVQKYAYRNDWQPEVPMDVKPESFPVLGLYIPTIDAWLEQDMREPRKQRHTAKRIFERLRDEQGYQGGYGSVKRYVCRKKLVMGKGAPDGCLPLAHPPAHAQVDFGKFKYYDAAGGEHRGYALLVSFPHSNAGWMQVFQSENQECLLEGLKRIFAHIGGAPARVRCDNMTTAVAQVLRGHERVVTDGFRRFLLHYRMEAEFCNPASGNEKGNVENKVGYTRRNLLVPVPTIEDWETFNSALLERCDADHERLHYQQGEKISALWEAEKTKLLTLPEYEYEVFRYEVFAVSKTGFVTIDTNKYGLSPELAGRVVQAKIWFDRVELFHDHRPVRTFTRVYGRDREVMDWRDYLPTLVKKPGAVAETRFFDQMPKLWQAHLEAAQGRERRSALALLLEIVSDGNDALCEDALQMAAERGCNDADSIRQCYYLISRRENHPQPLTLLGSAPRFDYRPNLSAYDVVAAKGGAAS